jgi:DNA/RNA endonuclease YhcR with UshA esterase domain
MSARVHHHPGLILSAGTQIVTLGEVLGPAGRVLQPRGAVGVIVRSPVDLEHPYRVRFLDGMETSISQD